MYNNSYKSIFYQVVFVYRYVNNCDMKNNLFACLLFATTFLSAGGTSSPVKIEADKTSGCVPLTVNFAGKCAEKDANWMWDFGNGTTSNKQTTAVVFLKPGVYEVNLLVNSHSGIQSAATVITVSSAPKADFIIEKSKACVNETLNFTNLSTAGSAPIEKNVWGFGDGKTVTSQNPQYRYTTAGNYNVTLVVTDINGCSADKTTYSSITVNPAPLADFKPSVLSSCSESQKVSFKNESKGNGLNYSWAFGDGAISTDETPTHLFAQGKHDVMLTVKDANECSSVAVKNVSVTKLHPDFTASSETPAAGEVVKFYSLSNYKGTAWAWDFGDGTVSNLHNPEKIYSTTGMYKVKFTLMDGVCSESVTKTSYVKVSKGTPVSFTSNVTSSCSSPMSVKFTNTTPNTALALWEFGDGTVSTNPNPEKVFANPGSYKVTLSVTDSSGYTVKKGIENYIQAARPMVRFACDTFGCVGYPVKFYNFTPNATSYLWNFGDGETSMKKDPTHFYKKNGYYSVSLTGKNADQCDSTFTLSNYVHIDSVKVDFEMASMKSAVPPFISSFTNKTQPANAKLIWDFGDTSSETTVNPVHLYDTPGSFKVRLVAYTKSGCSGVKVMENSFQMGTTFDEPLVRTGF